MLEPKAGSTPTRRRVMGTRTPTTAATRKFPTIAVPITALRIGLPSQTKMTAATSAPSTRPCRRPTPSSCRNTAQKSFKSIWPSGQRAHDDRHRLVAGIAALGRYYRHQRGQNRHGRDCAGELGHNRRRYQCRSQIDYKPWEAGADGAGQGAENDGLLTHLGQAVDVFGGFLLEYVYHIVYRDDAKQAILFIDDWHGEKIVARKDPGDLFLIGVHTGGQHFRIHDLFQFDCRVGEDERLQADNSHKTAQISNRQ